MGREEHGKRVAPAAATLCGTPSLFAVLDDMPVAVCPSTSR
jgi:hypothetical protein